MASCPAQEYSQGATFRNHRPSPTCFEARAKSCRLGQRQSPIRKISFFDSFLHIANEDSQVVYKKYYCLCREKIPASTRTARESRIQSKSWTRLTPLGLDLGRACQGLDSRGVPRTSCADHTGDERGNVLIHLEEQGVSQSISRSLAVLLTSQIHSILF